MNKKPKASTLKRIYTNKFPSFDTLDEMIAWAVERGATHMSLSNYHKGAFFKAVTPEKSRSYFYVMRFRRRYDYKAETQLEDNSQFKTYKNIGWYCYDGWTYGDIFDTKMRGEDTQPFFPIGYNISKKINTYLHNMKACNDYPKILELIEEK